MDTIGKRLKLERGRVGWTQERLAEEADISTPFVSDIENDKRNVSSQVIVSLADALDVTTDWLLKGIRRPSSKHSEGYHGVPLRTIIEHWVQTYEPTPDWYDWWVDTDKGDVIFRFALYEDD